MFDATQTGMNTAHDERVHAAFAPTTPAAAALAPDRTLTLEELGERPRVLPEPGPTRTAVPVADMANLGTPPPVEPGPAIAVPVRQRATAPWIVAAVAGGGLLVVALIGAAAILGASRAHPAEVASAPPPASAAAVTAAAPASVAEPPTSASGAPSATATVPAPHVAAAPHPAGAPTHAPAPTHAAAPKPPPPHRPASALPASGL